MKKTHALCCGILAASLIACGSNPQNTTKKTFRMCFLQDPNTLDPRKASDLVSGNSILMLFEGLTRCDNKDYQPQGAIAEKIEISEDKILYTFYLRDAYWSDGSMVTAYDFEYAWKSLIAPDFPCPNAHFMYPVKNAEKIKKGELPTSELGIKSLNSKTLEVCLEHPTPFFLELTSFSTFLPVPHKIVEKNKEWCDSTGESFVTNGAFTLDTWKRNQELVFTKNPYYWKKETIQLDQVHSYIIGNENTAFNMYQQGALDFYGGCLNSIPPDWILSLTKENQLLSDPLGASAFITFNVSHPYLQNKNIRKALCLAIDRSAITKHVTQFNEIPAFDIVPPVLKKGQSDFLFQDASSDQGAQAVFFLEKGLEELNITRKDFDKVTYHYFTQFFQKKIAQVIQQQWKNVLDIEIKLQELDFKVVTDKIYRKDYDITQIFWVLHYNDIMNILDRFRYANNAKNYPGWECASYNELLEQSYYKEGDERLDILKEAEKILLEDAPITCLFHWHSTYLKKDHVKNLQHNPTGWVNIQNIQITND